MDKKIGAFANLVGKVFVALLKKAIENPATAKVVLDLLKQLVKEAQEE